MTVTWVAAGRSDVGRVRPTNEDAFAVLDGEGIFLVADGMGGHAAGEVASRIAVEEIVVALREADPADRRGALVEDAIQRANARIVAEADRDPRHRGMGTTVTVLCVDAQSGRYTIGHVGDSRAYRFREDRLELLTRDHTWVQLQVEAGRLSPQEARVHPYSSVLMQALGTHEALQPDLLEGCARAGDLYLLCSDGLTATMDDGDLKRMLRRGADATPGALAEALVQEANERGAPDNVTVIVVRAVPAGEDGAAA